MEDLKLHTIYSQDYSQTNPVCNIEDETYSVRRDNHKEDQEKHDVNTRKKISWAKSEPGK